VIDYTGVLEMGMFDNIRYDGYNYQTKDTPAQALDQYHIKDDGTLWHTEYDVEWIEDGGMFGGYIEQHNHRDVFCADFTGEIRFYRSLDKEHRKWEEYSTYFLKGNLREIHKISGD
jgi:hypothetical protein